MPQPSALPRARLVCLEDGQSSALVYPEQGFQLHGFQVGLPGGRQVEAIHRPPELREPGDRRYGNPVLFPAVGVSNGSQPDHWDHQGKPLAMSMHGWARNVYWQVESMDARQVTAALVPHNGFKLVYPFDFEMRLTYALEGRSLSLTTVLTNTGTVPFPYALGFHPYLRVPFASGPTPEARERCRMDLPGGVRLTTNDAWRTIARAPVPARSIAASLAELPGSIVLTETGARALEVRDEAAGVATQVSVEDSEQTFPVWVIWSAAPDAPYVCLEPWTDAPNALNRPDTRTLAPGATHRYRMVISVRAL